MAVVSSRLLSEFLRAWAVVLVVEKWCRCKAESSTALVGSRFTVMSGGSLGSEAEDRGGGELVLERVA